MYTIIVTDLYAKDPSTKTTSYEFEKDFITFGRSRANDVVIRQTNISTSHASVSKKSDGFYLEDLNSTNGTVLNKNPIQGSIKIYVDDEIELGGALIRISGHPLLERSSDKSIAEESQSSKSLNLDDDSRISYPSSLSPKSGMGFPSGDSILKGASSQDFSLSEIAPLPSVDFPQNNTSDSILPYEDSRIFNSDSLPPEESEHNPFPKSVGDSQLFESRISQVPIQDDLLDKINSLESKAIERDNTDSEQNASSIPITSTEESAIKKMNDVADEVPDAPNPVSPVTSSRPDNAALPVSPPVPPANEPLINQEKRRAVIAPFPDTLDPRPDQDHKEIFDHFILSVVVSDPEFGSTEKYEFTKQPIILGRDDICDISLESVYISGKHVSIEYTDGQLFVRDLNSSNGTFVNTQKIEGQKQIEPDDMISAGHIGLSISIREAATNINEAAHIEAKQQDFKQPQPSEAPLSGVSNMRISNAHLVDSSQIKEEIAENVHGVALQLHMARVTLGKGLDSLQQEKLGRQQLLLACKPLAQTIRMLYNAQTPKDSNTLQGIVDRAIAGINSTLVQLKDDSFSNQSYTELLKAHAILYPLSSEGLSSFSRVSSTGGVSLLADVGLLGLQKRYRISKEELILETAEIKGDLLTGLKLNSSLQCLPFARTLARSIAEEHYFSDSESLKLVSVVDEACTNVVEHAFEYQEGQTYYLLFAMLSDNRLAVIVDDKGVPLNIDKANEHRLDGLGFKLMRTFCDEIHFINRGRKGKRLVAIFTLPQRYSATFFPTEAHANNAEIIDKNSPLEIKIISSEMADYIPACAYRTHRFEYYDDIVYQPNELRLQIKEGRMLSVVAFTESGTAVGHMSVRRETADSQIGQLEHLIIVPSLNSANIASKLTAYLVDYCRSQGMIGLNVKMTASHPYEQIVYGSLGAINTGIMLGSLPISGDQPENAPQHWGIGRQSVVTAYIGLNDDEPRKVYIPERYSEILENIYAKLNLRRNRRPLSSKEKQVMPAISNVETRINRALGTAVIRVLSIGDDTIDVVGRYVEEYQRENIPCIYLDLPLTSPSIGSVTERLHELHMYYSCILPRTTDGDILRLQTANFTLNISEIKVEKNFGKLIFDKIIAEKNTYRSDL